MQRPSFFTRCLAAVLVVFAGAANAQTLVSPGPDALSNGGLYFDIAATPALSITQLVVPISSPNPGQVLEVWSRPGTYVGFDGAAAGWTLAGTVSAAVSPATVSVNIPLLAGQRRGIHLTTGGVISRVSFDTGAGGVGVLAANNAQLQTYEGTSTGTRFGAAGAFSRRFVGTITYTVGGPVAAAYGVPALSAWALLLLAFGVAASGLHAWRGRRPGPQ